MSEIVVAIALLCQSSNSAYNAVTQQKIQKTCAKEVLECLGKTPTVSDVARCLKVNQ